MLPKTTPTQRQRFYRDVEDLISPGFLSHNISVAGVRLVLRTLGPGDLFLLRARTGPELDDWQLWALASSVWMVNGTSVLDSPGLVPRIYQMLKALHLRAQVILFSTFSGLLNRQSKAEEAVESFMYESMSRTRWRAVGGDPMQMAQGIRGADRIGQNLVQQIWTVFNEMEDRRVAFDHQWEGFKLVASSNSPKGVQKIDERDTRKRMEEEDRRQSVMDRYYYYRMGKVDREGFVKSRDRDVIGARIGGPKSVEVLEEEMKRWVAGDHDEHDAFIEDYKQRILDRQAAVEEQAAERRRRLAAEAENRSALGFDPTPMVGYTQEQLAQILANRDGGVRAAGARFIQDDTRRQMQDKVSRYSRPVAGSLKVEGDRLVDPNANPSTDARTLQQIIEQRPVPFGDEPQQPPPEPAARPAVNRPNRPPNMSQSEWDEFGSSIDPAVFGGQAKGSD